MNLAELKIGKTAIIKKIAFTEINLYKHILDMGLTEGVIVEIVKIAPLGDPLELKVRGYSLTLRKDDAKNIEIEEIERPKEKANIMVPKRSEHPLKGEDSQKRLPLFKKEDEHFCFALAGNQNSGKTTLFNDLTGSNQHVGNFPGVTVDAKSGTIIDHDNLEVIDLPGIYSLSPYTNEEIVTREFILKNDPDAIINIIDATNIERNLYLTLQLIELQRPMVIALNMMDEVKENNGSIDINGLEAALGVPVIPISAIKSEGIGELIARGPNIMSGYYENEEETARVLADGWLHTGDLASVDSDGFIFIRGRKKNVIVLKNGKNVYPEELELLISNLPYVEENMVFGQPRHKDGDHKDLALCAKIVYKPDYMKESYGTDDPAEIERIIKKDIDMINEELPTYKQMLRLIVTDEPMIKTTTGKVKRYEETKNM